MTSFCFVLTTVEGYGADKSLLNQILKIKGIYNLDIYVIAREKGITTEILRENNIKIIFWHYYINVTFLKRFKYKFFIYFRNLVANFLNKISAFLFFIRYRKYKFDLIHTNTIITDFGYQLSKLYKSIDVWHLREIPEAFNIYFPLNYLTNNTNRIFFSNSDYVFKYYLKKYKINSKVVDNIINLNIPEFRKRKKNQKIFRFCFIGRLSKDKDPMTVLKAFFRAFGKNNNLFPKPILEIYGEGEMINDILNFIDKYDLKNQIYIRGYKSDIIKFIKKTDVGICSSRLEAFGRVTIEYMLSSLVVIATNSGNNKFLVKNKKTGLIYPFGNSASLAKKMKMVYEDKNLYKELSQSGYLWAKKRFNENKSTDDFMKPILERIENDKK